LWHIGTRFRDILKRLSQVKKGKIFGQEFELDEKLDQLKETTEKAQEEVASREPRTRQSKPIDSEAAVEHEQLRNAQKLEQEILSQARTSPKVALMLVSAEIDRRLRELLTATG
jgi:hypothetical protein